MCMFVVLRSFFCSEKAIRAELDAMDKNETPDPAGESELESLNAVAGILFGAGVVMLLMFASCNLTKTNTGGNDEMANDGKTSVNHATRMDMAEA